MIISITTSRPDSAQRVEVETFLGGFLPRLERQPGVVAVYHYSDEASGESTTLVVWQDEASRLAYRESDLIGEAIRLERRLGLTSTRRAFPPTYP